MQGVRKKNISIIPSRPDYDRSIKVQLKALRVAAYCRVSTLLEQQESSYEAQIAYLSLIHIWLSLIQLSPTLKNMVCDVLQKLI